VNYRPYNYRYRENEEEEEEEEEEQDEEDAEGERYRLLRGALVIPPACRIAGSSPGV
jgi:hypothetical protein